MVTANEFLDLENKARAATLQFVAEALHIDPAGLPGSQQANSPEARLAYILQDLALGKPEQFHRIARAAWAMHCSQGMPHWPALWTASRLAY